MDRSRYLDSTFGLEQSGAARGSRVLVVGAGGIGCEVLKNLVMCCVKDITVVDLDTIDVSNLNRQFLFRRKHVGMSKATVAAEMAMKFNPSVKITAHHGNIKDPKYDVDFFSKFRVVLSALDNVDARRHVNRMCLAAGVVEIESGSTGYLGQVVPIQKGVSECYECSSKPTQRVYPICTIRSTPDKPVHCIVWAKELFKLLFGISSESMLAGAEPSADGVADEKTAGADGDAAPAIPDTYSGMSTEGMSRLAGAVARYYFVSDLEKKIAAGMYATSNSVPTPIDSAVLVDAESAGELSENAGWDRRVWSDVECVRVMLSCMCEGFKRKADTGAVLEFDKDDKLAMKFVTAASNLRAATFSIPTSSFYDAKGVAGNIIPAISSTNAIIAGLQVTQAMLLLKEKEVSIKDRVPMVFCQRNPNRLGIYLQPMHLDPPSSSCYVCNTSQLTLKIDTNVFTLQDLIKDVVKAKLGFVEPSLDIGSSNIYEEGEDSCDSHLKYFHKKLCDCPAGGIRNGTILTIEDFRQDLKVVVVTKHVDLAELDEEKYPSRFSIEGYVAPSAASDAAPAPVKSESAAAASDDDDVVICVDDIRVGVVDISAAGGDDDGLPAAKKRRLD